MTSLPLALGMPGPFELILLMGLGLLFFGKRLPEVGRSIGQTVVQFKKGLSEMEHDIHNGTNGTSAGGTVSTPIVPQIEVRPVESRPVVDQSNFKFDPHTGKPIQPAVAEPLQEFKFDPHTGKPIEQPESAVS